MGKRVCLLLKTDIKTGISEIVYKDEVEITDIEKESDKLQKQNDDYIKYVKDKKLSKLDVISLSSGNKQVALCKHRGLNLYNFNYIWDTDIMYQTFLYTEGEDLVKITESEEE